MNYPTARCKVSRNVIPAWPESFLTIGYCFIADYSEGFPTSGNDSITTILTPKLNFETLFD